MSILIFRDAIIPYLAGICLLFGPSALFLPYFYSSPDFACFLELNFWNIYLKNGKIGKMSIKNGIFDQIP